jgi:retron-type reverse transcriptase
LLSLPAAGNRNNNDGALFNRGNNGNYWSSTENGTDNAWNLNFNSGNANTNNNNRRNGNSVRCAAAFTTAELRERHLVCRSQLFYSHISAFIIHHHHYIIMVSTQDEEWLLCSLYQAYFDARRNKRNTISQLRFELRFESCLVELYEELLQRRYTIRPGIAFIIDKPVKREVLAADFRDRVVHHLLYNLVNPVFDAGFIPESFSCRVGRGTHFGIATLFEAIRTVSRDYRQDCFILKLDIKGYFMSIDRKLLGRQLYDRIAAAPGLDSFKKDLALYLCAVILADDPTARCIIRGNRRDWDGLPPSKSLFHARPDCGLPIGNLTSQLFSNVYLDEFDHFVKYQLGFRHYGRYVDDFYLVHTDEARLKAAIPLIRDYLASELGLTLHPDKVFLQHFSKGVNFLGATLKCGRLYVSNRVRRNFERAVRDWALRLQETAAPDQEMLVQLRASVNSYLGILRHYRTFRIRERVLLQGRYDNLYRYGYLKWVPRRPMNFHILRKYLAVVPPGKATGQSEEPEVPI